MRSEIQSKVDKKISFSIVIPVYRGETTLENLVNDLYNVHQVPELIELNSVRSELNLNEIILVNDGGSQELVEVLKQLENKYKIVSVVWLTKNFGQHAATLAGIQNSNSQWIITMDEDGRHNPQDFSLLFYEAFRSGADVVYGENEAADSHRYFRRASSKYLKKFVAKILFLRVPDYFSSFRLISGEVGRSLAIYAGRGVYLDAGLMWITDKFSSQKVKFRPDQRKSSYNLKRLIEHFARLIISSGVPPLRLVFILALLVFLGSISLAGYIVLDTFMNGSQIQGWASVMVVLLLFFGFTVFMLGLIAEFTGAQLRMQMGQPHYVVKERPNSKND